MNVKRTLSNLLAAALLASAASQAAAEDEILFNVFTPPKANPSAKVILPWIAALNEAGKGEFKIDVPPKSLAPPPRQMDIVTQGIADGAFIFNAFLQKRVPHVQLALLPLTTTTAEADGVALWRTYQKFFEAADPFKDVVLLGFFGAPAGHIYSMQDAQIKTVAQLKSIKMWSLPGYPSLMLKDIGTAVVPGPAVRIYPIVSKGTVDAFCCIDMADAYAFKASQFAKSVTTVPGGMFSASFSVFMSKSKWSSLSPRTREIIQSMSGEKIARRAKGWDDIVAASNKKFTANGRPIVAGEAALISALRDAAQPLHDAWTAQADKLGMDGKAVLAYYLAEAKKLAGGN